MKNSSWKDYAEIFGIAAIVASLIFVGLQMRQDRVIAVADVQASLLESYVEIRSDINQNAEVWYKGLAGGQLSDTDAIIFSNLAASLRRHTNTTSGQLRSLRGLGFRDDLAIYQFADLVRRNPGLAEEMAKEDARIRTAIGAASTPLQEGPFRGKLKEATERLDQLEPITESL